MQLRRLELRQSGSTRQRGWPTGADGAGEAGSESVWKSGSVEAATAAASVSERQRARKLRGWRASLGEEKGGAEKGKACCERARASSCRCSRRVVVAAVPERRGNRPGRRPAVHRGRHRCAEHYRLGFATDTGKWRNGKEKKHGRRKARERSIDASAGAAAGHVRRFPRFPTFA